MAEKDFRVRCNLRFLNFGVATGLQNQMQNQMDKTVNINEGLPNQEICFTRLDDHYDVSGDMNFPPENEGIARGVIDHIADVFGQAVIIPDVTSFYELERCGHRIQEQCDIVERHVVV